MTPFWQSVRKGSAAGVGITDALKAVRKPLAELIVSERGCEVCALVAALPDRFQLIALRSVRRGLANFAIPECEWARVERWAASRGGRMICLIHSHPGCNSTAMLEPSDVDMRNMAATPDIPWVIVGCDGLVSIQAHLIDFVDFVLFTPN
jgi:proteasome lid subunit RPN8/RPN11